MANTTRIDWAALKNYVDSVSALPPHSAVNVGDESKRLIRLQRFIRRFARVSDPVKSRDAMIELAQEFHLDWFRAARLFVKLQRLSSLHSFGLRIESYERAGDAVKDLEIICKSLTILQKFSERALADDPEPRMRIAEKKLENAAHFWADDCRRRSEHSGKFEQWEEVEAHGFVLSPNVDSSGAVYPNYNSFSVLRMWLRNNVLFSKLVINIIAKERNRKPEPSGTSGKMDELSRVEIRDGKQLPELYERYAGKKFGFSTERDGSKLAYRNGPKFAAMCFPVMGLAKPSLETLRTHWKKASSGAAKSRMVKPPRK